MLVSRVLGHHQNLIDFYGCDCGTVEKCLTHRLKKNREPIRVQFGEREGRSIRFRIIFILAEPSGEPLCPVDAGGGVSLEQTTPMKVELFHQRIKVIGQKNCSIDFLLKLCKEKNKHLLLHNKARPLGFPFSLYINVAQTTQNSERLGSQ